MGVVFSILFKIIFYVSLIGIAHYTIIYAQNTFTKPKQRIIATDQLLYTAVEEKLKETIDLTNENKNENCDVISTTSIDQIPTHHIDEKNDNTDMKEQLKNFLKSSNKASS
jgi:hypothetical protein|tara:strand:- start:276 stop:608 length:333 start_codon:yes stop_codon:yes gene_type:complete